jgi:hypothetical protein
MGLAHWPFYSAALRDVRFGGHGFTRTHCTGNGWSECGFTRNSMRSRWSITNCRRALRVMLCVEPPCCGKPREVTVSRNLA